VRAGANLCFILMCGVSGQILPMPVFLARYLAIAGRSSAFLAIRRLAVPSAICGAEVYRLVEPQFRAMPDLTSRRYAATEWLRRSISTAAWSGFQSQPDGMKKCGRNEAGFWG